MKVSRSIVWTAAAFLSVLVVQGSLVPVEAKQGSSSAMIERGHFLVTLGGCNDCHSPKKMTPSGLVPDPALLLSGHPHDEVIPAVPKDLIMPGKWGGLFNGNLTAWVGPWGTSYAANLSPDRDTGTGAWNDELFIRIFRTGKFMGSGRDILPPMPWSDIGKLSDNDLKAILAYLKSITPIRNQVPASVPAVMPR